SWMRLETSSYVLQGAFRQSRCNGNFLNLHFNVVCNFQNNEVVSHLGDPAGDTTGGNHFITLVQAGHQGLMLFCTLGLRAPDQEVENQDEAGEEDDLTHHAHSLGTSI